MAKIPVTPKCAICLILALGGCQPNRSSEPTFGPGRANDQKASFPRIDRTRPVPSFRTLSAAAFSPDGKYLLTGYKVDNGFPTKYDDTKLITLWEVETGKKIRTLIGHKRCVDYLAFLPDGKEAVSCGWDGTVKVWDVTTGLEIRSINAYEGHAFLGGLSPDGKKLITWGVDSSAHAFFALWDVATGNMIQGFEDTPWNVKTISLSQDGTYALLGCVPTPFDNGGVRVFNTKTDKVIQDFDSHDKGWGWYGWISPVGTLIALTFRETPFSRAYLVLWDFVSQKEIKRFDTLPELVTALGFTSDGKHILLLKGNKASLAIWDVATGKENEPKTEVNGILAFSPDGRVGVTENSGDSKGEFALNSRLELGLLDLSSGQQIQVLYPTDQ